MGDSLLLHRVSRLLHIPGDMLNRYSVRSEGVPILFAAGVLLIASISAVLIAVFYTTGDAGPYTTFYSSLREIAIDNLYYWQRCAISSSDPIYAIFSWVFAHTGASRLVFIALMNVTLIGLAGLWLRRNAAPWPTWLLLFSNYYVIMLFGTADRLKMSVLLLLGALLVHVPWQRAALVVLSLGTHLQGAMLFGAWVCGRLPEFAPRLLRERRHALIAGAVVLGLAAAFLFFGWREITIKVAAYSNRSRGLVEAADFVVLIAVGLLAARDWRRVILTQLPLVIFAVVLGNSRMTIVGFFLLLEQIVEERRSGHPAFLALMAFMTYKSVNFIESLVATGNGFWTTASYQAPTLATCGSIPVW